MPGLDQERKFKGTEEILVPAESLEGMQAREDLKGVMEHVHAASKAAGIETEPTQPLEAVAPKAASTATLEQDAIPANAQNIVTGVLENGDNPQKIADAMRAGDVEPGDILSAILNEQNK